MEAAAEALGSGARPLQTLRAHRGEVTCCDAAGTRFVTGGGEGTLVAWRWQAGDGWTRAGDAPRAHRYGVTAARWAPGGCLLASGGVDGAARVWDGRELAPRVLLAAPAAPALRALCWAGAARLLCGYDDGAVLVWLVRDASLLARVGAHQGALHALAAPARGALLLAACTEGVLKVFDLQEVCRRADSGEGLPAPLLWADGAHDMGALCADAAADGRLAATGGHDARVRVWRVEGEGRGRVVVASATLEGHGAAVTAVRFARDGILVTASLDRMARLWSIGAADTAVCLGVLHAHTRYLTCVAVEPDLRYLLTGSNDKSARMWALRPLSLDDDLEPPCAPYAHFGVGDLEGIGPVDDDELLRLEEDDARASALPGSGDADETDTASGGAGLVWRSRDDHNGAVNCIATSGDLLATACSDGIVRIFRWNVEAAALQQESAVDTEGEGLDGVRGYPALAVDFGASGAVLLAAGMGGAAHVLDTASGLVLRALAPPAPANEGGGSGIRMARVSPHRPPLLLLATDDGVAPVWSLSDPDPEPLFVYGGHVEAAMCCAWSGDGRLAATGGAAGELRIHAAPPLARTLQHQADAHDLGVQSCDFASEDAVRAAGADPDHVYLLATAGCDGLLRIWAIEYLEDEETVHLRELCSVPAHGGGAACVRWGNSGGDTRGALLVSGGADRWARVWRVRAAGARIVSAAAVPAGNAGGAPAVAVMDGGLLAVGTLSGELALWRLPQPAADSEDGNELAEAGWEAEESTEEEEDEGADVRWWGPRGVVRWLREYVTRAPGGAGVGAEAHMVKAIRGARLSGGRLLDDPLDDLLQLLGYGDEPEELDEADRTQWEATRTLLREELEWLRAPLYPSGLEATAPHALLCPLTHRVLRDPARAADGVTYDRAALLEWFIAKGGAVSAVSGRRLRNSRVHPNYGARAALRAFLARHASP